MRKSKSSKRTRLIRAGFTTAVVGAGLLVAPQTAWAAGTASPSLAAPASTITVADSAYTYGSGHVVEATNATSCSTRYTTPNNTAYWAATPAAVSTNTHAIAVTLPALPTGTNGSVRAYMLCVYDSTSTTAAVLQTSASVNIAAIPTLSNTQGQTGGGNQLTLTTSGDSPLFTGQTTIGTVFSTAACPATYGTPTAGTATDAMRMSNTQAMVTVPNGVTTSTAGPAVYNVCLYAGNQSASTLLSAAPYSVGKITLSQNSGPISGGNGLTITSVNDLMFAGINPAIVMLTASPTPDCPAHYATTNNSTNRPVPAPRKLGNNQLAFQVPDVGTSASTWQLCVFDSTDTTNSVLLASALYQVVAPSIPTRVSPSAGPTIGGTDIVVSGTDFPTAPGTITATLGGVPLVNIVPRSATAFTARTSPHSIDPGATLVVTTPNGTRSLANAFVYQNSLTVSPSSAPNTTTGTDVQVSGSGFLNYTFGGGSASRSRVFLVNGVYNPADVSGGTVRANGPVAECSNVLVVSDSFLVCSLALNRRLNNATNAFFDPWAYQNLSKAGAAPDVVTTTNSKIINITSSANGTFSQDDVGQPITDGGTNFAPGTTITSVLSPLRATISQNPLHAATSSGVLIGNATGALAGATPAHAFPGDAVTNHTGWTTTNGSATVTTDAGHLFTAADVGRVVYGTATHAGGTAGIDNGNTIIAVAGNGLTATLSAPAEGVLTEVTANLYNPPGAVHSFAGGSSSGWSVTSGSTTVTTDAAQLFTSADVGRVVYGVATNGSGSNGIDNGTTITAVAPNGRSATISQAAEGTLTNVSAYLYPANPVPNGAYIMTVVSNGAVDANTTDANYQQSALTSGATFTVAPS